MDFSDLPQSAQDRIAAAEIDADSIAANADESAKQIVERFQWGADPLGLDSLLYGDSTAVRAAREESSSGRQSAAGNLFGAIAREYLNNGPLDFEKFIAKLDTIGNWVAQKYGISRTVLEQMKQECRKIALRRRAAAAEASEAPKGTIIEKLPPESLVRLEAATAAFLADYLPKLEREANRRGPVHDAELLRELVINQFNLVARECMAVCASADEFDGEMHSDIARFVHFGLSQYRWLAGPMRQELESGFTFFVARANPWASVPAKDRATKWHVGAITGEALTHAALKLRAEAWTRAAAGGFSEPAEAGATEPSGDVSTPTEAAPEDGEKIAKRVAPIPEFPKRASWLKDRLRERSWNKHDLSRQGGPDHKTVQKILDGYSIREDVLQKVADGLSKREGKVNLLDIPQD